MRDEELREMIEEWLWQREALNSGFHDGQRQSWAAGARLDLDDLLPVVRRYADQRVTEELRAAAKWASLEAASHDGYAAKGMARNTHLREAEARVFRATSNRLNDRADALAVREATT